MDSEKKSHDPDHHDFGPNALTFPALPELAPPYSPPLPGAQVITLPPPYSKSPNAINPKHLVIAPRTHLNDYLMVSIVTLLFFFPPLGIAAAIFSCKTRRSLLRGDMTAAERTSRVSFWLNVAALVLGVIIHAVWISLLIHTVLMKRNTGSAWNAPTNGGGHNHGDWDHRPH